MPPLTLGRVEGSLGCPSRATTELGSPELQSAVGGAFEAADSVALAMADALAGASRNLSANASGYAGTEASASSSFAEAANALPEPADAPPVGAP